MDLVALGGIFVLGVSVGLTACAASCLPFIGTWALARGKGGWDAAEDLAAFLAGRLAGYGLLGGIAGWAGESLGRILAGPLGHGAIGLAGIAAGLALVWRPRRPTGCAVSRAPLPPLLLGAALSLTPCAPLASLLAAAALAAQPLQGGIMGIVFGLGAAVTPLALVVPVLGLLGRNLRLQGGVENWLRWSGAGVLVALGLRRLSLLVGI
ncbi:sulfite exporter TauE/SafE family protein [Magnetospirillum sulfuroxidans]|uniref:Sulfite exporter TauE/SafE family protein n=1 Tax=Magnetospirillum sulfuroxidans TaxID=611300 RepID=A0ABS5I9W5_9PROT|nr:sulfite exporter TauE/SafE family protein [Magnetospirillum sulfuroxidans]MBR9970947.1 sulfite exporter TauE/SafE family protein [Magnetospirillum sulfuroxidans]